MGGLLVAGVVGPSFYVASQMQEYNGRAKAARGE